MEQETTRQFGAPVAEIHGRVTATLSLAAALLFSTASDMLGQTIAALLAHHALRRFRFADDQGGKKQMIWFLADFKKESGHSFAQDAIYSRIWSDIIESGEEGVWELLDFAEKSGDGLASYTILMSLSYFYRALGFGREADDYQSQAEEASHGALSVADMNQETALRLGRKMARWARRFAEENGLNVPKTRVLE
jgi:hypothetical protein